MRDDTTAAKVLKLNRPGVAIVEAHGTAKVFGTYEEDALGEAGPVMSRREAPYYEQVANKFIEQLEAGTALWQTP